MAQCNQKWRGVENNWTAAFDHPEGLTSLEDDQCEATKLGPDGPEGLRSIYVACWNNLPLTGILGLQQEPVPLNRA